MPGADNSEISPQTVKNTKTTRRSHLWAPGESGNPNGRPKGSKNKSTALIREMIDGMFLQHLPPAIKSMRRLSTKDKLFALSKFAKFAAPSLISMEVDMGAPESPDPEWAKGLTKEDIKAVMDFIRQRAEAHGDSGGTESAPGEAQPS